MKDGTQEKLVEARVVVKTKVSMRKAREEQRPRQEQRKEEEAEEVCTCLKGPSWCCASTCALIA